MERVGKVVRLHPYQSSTKGYGWVHTVCTDVWDGEGVQPGLERTLLGTS